MDFQPNEQQRMLCAAARKFFAQEFPLARLRTVEAQGLAAFLPLYREMGRLGYLGLAIPEDSGGAGGDWLDLALFAEEAGRALLPTLPISSLVIGAQALLQMGGDGAERIAALVSGERILAPALLEDAEADREPPRKAHALASGDGFELTGEKRFVYGFDVADELLIPLCADAAQARLAIVPCGGAGISATDLTLSSLDRVYDLRLQAVRVGRHCLLEGSWNTWLELIDGAKIIAASWAVGAARAALDMALRYAGERQQFGQPIGAFQAVQHRLADAAIVLEQASAMTRYAAWRRASAAPCRREAAMAKLMAGRAILQVTHAATLTHGGYGFMEEFDIQLYCRRAKLFDQLVEGPVLQRELIADERCEDLLGVA